MLTCVLLARDETDYVAVSAAGSGTQLADDPLMVLVLVVGEFLNHEVQVDEGNVDKVLGILCHLDLRQSF